MDECTECSAVVIDEPAVTLPKRDYRTHKGDYGKVLLIGGSRDYPGSINLAALAAVRSGAGLVYLAVPECIWSICAVKNQEAMPRHFAEDTDGRISFASIDRLKELWEPCNVIAVGPGLGRSEDTKKIVYEILENFPGKILLDADALWAVAQNPEKMLSAAGRTVITPHAGEFARLGGDITGNRLQDAAAFSEKWECITVLKGFGTVVATPEGDKFIISAGNPGMAKGGSGDVLTGVLAAMLGQFSIKKAVVTGTWIHSAAGDMCAEEKGEYGMIPSDIIEKLPVVMKKITH